ncbi:hypothetical protein ColKHC_05966 [Colletotrichum higginsianum]|nr:hypothetical protein ColKHC_05966 [Colletotrichum higginsianum]
MESIRQRIQIPDSIKQIPDQLKPKSPRPSTRALTPSPPRSRPPPSPRRWRPRPTATSAPS